MIARVISGNNDIYSLSKTLLATYEPTKSVFLLDEQLILNDIRAEFSFSLRLYKINKLIQTPYYYL